MYQLEPSFPDVELVLSPTQDDLSCDDGEPMETCRYKLQMDLLVNPLIQWLVIEQQRGFVSGNMFVYFSPNQVRNQDYKRAGCVCGFRCARQGTQKLGGLGRRESTRCGD
jgi:hypothetical protein